MLDMLKADIIRESNTFVLEQSILDEVNNTDIRDAFLDDDADGVSGDANDNKIEKLIQDIPEYDSEDTEDISLESMIDIYLGED